MANYETILVRVDEPFVYITLNRPEVRNAMNQKMISELLDIFTFLKDEHRIRGVVISGAGDTFCAGEDTRETQTAYAEKDYSSEDHTAEYDLMLQTVNTAPQVVVARIDGAAMGGGLGLVCVSDVAIATIDTIFALPEVRLGVVPALIAPYLIRRVGLTVARRLMLTGARFDGHEAVIWGVTNEVAAPGEDLDLKVEQTLADIREASPGAIAACKQMLFDISAMPIPETTRYRAQLLDQLRRSDEGQEGMLAFIRKRKPSWAKVAW